MEKNIVNVRDMAFYYAGGKLFWGEIQTTLDGKHKVFVNKEGCFMVELTKENTNVDFSLKGEAIMVLKDAIEGNAYGEDRNLGLENAGLDEVENGYINLMYKIGEMKYEDFYLRAFDLGQKITSRLQKVEAEKQFYSTYCKMVNESRNATEEHEA